MRSFSPACHPIHSKSRVLKFDFQYPNGSVRGICVSGQTRRSLDQATIECLEWLAQQGISDCIDFASTSINHLPATQFALTNEKCEQWTPNGNTLRLAPGLSSSNRTRCDLEAEILLAMLACPVAFVFPSLRALESHIRVRCNIVEAAVRTFLSFATLEAERPADYWKYDTERGFFVRPGRSMIEALRKATQPTDKDFAYSFSCYRATEYIIALSLAEEARYCNQELLKKLQRQAETRAIKSREFHEVFMNELGSRDCPLPTKYYVPGDRVWFRNPDAISSSATGYEGSWVFYLGGGLFSNFWECDQAFTLQAKCLEIFHWRNAVYRDSRGEFQIDETAVQNHVQASLQNPIELDQILQSMEKLQDPRGVYSVGGCMDPTREYPKSVQRLTTDIVLPDAH